MAIPPCSISWKERPPTDSFQKGCGFLGLVMILLQVFLSIVIIAGKNAYFYPVAAPSEKANVEVENNAQNDDISSSDENQCPVGWLPSRDYLFCMKKDLKDDIEALNCEWSSYRGLEGEVFGNEDLMNDELIVDQSRHQIFRRLEGDDDTMFDRFSDNAHIPAILIPLVFICGIVWVYVMQRCAKTCIYGAIAFGVALSVFMSIFPMLITVKVCRQDGGSDFPVADDSRGTQKCLNEGGTIDSKTGELQLVFLIPAIVMIIATICLKKKINVAAICLSKCCLSLQERPMIIVASLGVFASFAFYLGMWIGFALNVLRNFEAKCIDGQKSYAPVDNETIMRIMSFLMPLTYIYFEMMVTVVVACGVGGWYFQDGEGLPANPAFEGLKWAYSTSTGATFLSTIITWPIVEIRNYIFGKWAKFAICPCLPCSWLYYILFILWCCVLRTYLAFTKFMLISHTFHGGDVFGTAKNAWAILKKHLGGAVVTDSIAAYVLGLGVWILSIAFVIATWVWMESDIGSGILSDLFSNTADGSSTLVLVVVLLGIVSWLCHHSLWTIILIILLSPIMVNRVIDGADKFHGLMAGLFVGAISNIIFCFLARIIQAGMDTIFYCFALESEHAVTQARQGVADIREMIKANIVTPLPGYLVKEEAKAQNNQNLQVGEGRGP